MSWDAAPTGRRGRQRNCSDAAIQTCLTMKVLFGMALRQTTARGAAAIIPPRKNAKPWKPDIAPGAIARNEAFRATGRFGRTIWRRW
jgi:hypothetical protein